MGAGATCYWTDTIATNSHSFNPHPPVGAGATRPAAHIRLRPALVSILTRPWERVQRDADGSEPAKRHVSILTRPWGRVQLKHRLSKVIGVPVSILTRPWGRVQLSSTAPFLTSKQRFQSSPARGGGCNSSAGKTHAFSSPFQSSPARGGGCNSDFYHAGTTQTTFQSSPARGDLIGVGFLRACLLADLPSRTFLLS